jgi:hypothetical protein
MQAEYRIKFITEDGIPVNGVQLEVQDREGNINYGYPINDYYEGNIPMSDTSGVVTFHHVFYFMEWGGTFFFGCTSGDPPPEFDLLFRKKGDVIYDIEFLELDGKVSTQTPGITRTVSVYDKESARAVYLDGNQDFSVQVVEQTLEFWVLEQTVVVLDRKLK